MYQIMLKMKKVRGDIYYSVYNSSYPERLPVQPTHGRAAVEGPEFGNEGECNES